MNKLPELELSRGEFSYNYFLDKNTQEIVPEEDVLFMYNTLAKMFNGAIEEFNNNV
jgi:hypothetical protein